MATVRNFTATFGKNVRRYNGSSLRGRISADRLVLSFLDSHWTILKIYL